MVRPCTCGAPRVHLIRADGPRCRQSRKKSMTPEVDGHDLAGLNASRPPRPQKRSSSRWHHQPGPGTYRSADAASGSDTCLDRKPLTAWSCWQWPIWAFRWAPRPMTPMGVSTDRCRAAGWAVAADERPRSRLTTWVQPMAAFVWHTTRTSRVLVRGGGDDFSIDVIITAQVISVSPPRSPRGLHWDHLDPATVSAIPALKNHLARPGKTARPRDASTQSGCQFASHRVSPCAFLLRLVSPAPLFTLADPALTLPMGSQTDTPGGASDDCPAGAE
jgi:hypothetical protein